MLFKFLLSSLILIITFSLCHAQNVTNEIYLGKTITINSKILGEERPVFISTPQGYENSDQNYPVLYLLDGGVHFLHASGIVQFLSRNGRLPQMIVVGIPNTNRNRDFTPTAVKETQNSGGANNFLSFMKDELIPYVKNNYRTQPYKILFGHSLTGMFEIHSLATENELFNAYIIASPFLMYDNEVAIKSLESFLKKSPEFDNSIYITVGNEPDYYSSLGKLSNLFETYSSEKLNWKYVKMENEDHGSVPHKTIYDGLEFIYSGWRMTNDQLAKGVDAIDEHYNNLSRHFGYEIKIPEFLINQLGYQYINKNMISDALIAFKRNIELYPNSANVHDSMGDAYVAAGQLIHAKESYSKAIERGTVLSDPNLQIFKNNLANVVKQLAQ
jgi:predicted alpha/beta superfamily hydrolase